MFLSSSGVKLLEYVSINNFFIILVNNKKIFYNLIYSLFLVKLEILKIYIKTNLANKFIKCFKLFICTLIVFIIKKNKILYFCINY